MFHWRTSIFLFGLCVVIHPVNSAVLRVPQEYATIQPALDALQSGDTVLVDSGTYAEALTAPQVMFTLIGVEFQDTMINPLTIIDPSPLTESNRLACIRFPEGSSALIQNIRFVNGPAMYPRVNNAWGGAGDSTKELLTFRGCLFDSTFGGIRYADRDVQTHLVVENCRFHNITSSLINSRGPLTVSNCVFHGTNYAGVGGLDSVLVENCQFRDSVSLGWVGSYGANDTVRGCVFGPGTFGMAALGIGIKGPVTIENNLFSGIVARGPLVSAEFWYAGPMLFHDNLFVGPITPGFTQAQGIVMYWEEPHDSSLAATFTNNTFANYIGCDATFPLSKTMDLSAECVLERNRFEDLEPFTNPTIRTDSSASLERISENILRNTGNAVSAVADCLDARYNYWGDTTGPFHPTANPQGRGDAISNHVSFDPWYTDTSLLAVPEPRIPLPKENKLEAYPNPFNPITTLKLTVAEPIIVRIELFNILGRQVSELWSGPVAYRKEFSFDANQLQLASGVYFVKATDTIYNRPIASTKIVLLK